MQRLQNIINNLHRFHMKVCFFEERRVERFSDPIMTAMPASVVGETIYTRIKETETVSFLSTGRITGQQGNINCQLPSISPTPFSTIYKIVNLLRAWPY